MRPFEIDLDAETADPDGIADNNASDDATTEITLDGALTSGGTFTSADGAAYKISITDTATQDQSDSTFTVTGTDADGKAQTEDITGPGSGATVPSLLSYATITSISVAGGDSGDTVDIGTLAAGFITSKTYPLNYHAGNAATYAVDITGTINFTVQETFEDLKGVTAPSQDAAWHNLSALASKTADTVSVGTLNATAIRVLVNSYSAGAELQVHVAQGTSGR